MVKQIWLGGLAAMAAAVLVLGGCASDSGGSGGSSEVVPDPTWASIQENIWTPRCAESSCHSVDNPNPPQGLVWSDPQSQDAIGQVSQGAPTLLIIDPGNPDDSYMIHKLEGTQSAGSRMPLIGDYLGTETIAAMRQWISDGAPVP